jgi:hypothetical protein
MFIKQTDALLQEGVMLSFVELNGRIVKKGIVSEELNID